MDAVFIWILAPSAFGLPGALAGWMAGRHGGRAAALLAVLFGVVVLAIITRGQSIWNSDPFGPWAVLVLLAVVGVNACTAFGGVALARHAQHRDDHLT